MKGGSARIVVVHAHAHTQGKADMHHTTPLHHNILYYIASYHIIPHHTILHKKGWDRAKKGRNHENKQG
jgi:hypothetical protein